MTFRTMNTEYGFKFVALLKQNLIILISNTTQTVEWISHVIYEGSPLERGFSTEGILSFDCHKKIYLKPRIVFCSTEVKYQKRNRSQRSIERKTSEEKQWKHWRIEWNRREKSENWEKLILICWQYRSLQTNTRYNQFYGRAGDYRSLSDTLPRNVCPNNFFAEEAYQPMTQFFTLYELNRHLCLQCVSQRF